VSTPTLRRDLGLLDAVGVGLGAVIGAGLFVVTGVAAGVAGPAFVVGLVVAGVAATCNALSSAALAAVYPQAGGTYEYGHRLLHPWAGFAAGWLFVVSKLAAGGTVALGFGGYLHALAPAVPPRAAAVAAVALLTAANLAGVRKAGRLNVGIVAVTVASLVAFVLLGAPGARAANWTPFAPAGVRGVLEASALLFFAYTGYARVTTLGEEVRDPTRTIPRAIALTVAISVALYLAVGAVAVGLVGADALAATTAPLDRAAAAVGPGVRAALAVGAATAMLGVLLSQGLGISRMLFAMARRGDLPGVLARVHPATGVPHVGVLTAGAVVAGLALVGTLDAAVSAAAFTILLYYGIANVCAWRLPAAQRRWLPRAVPAVGLAACLLLAASLAPATVGAGLGLLAVGAAVRIVVRRLARDTKR